MKKSAFTLASALLLTTATAFSQALFVRPTLRCLSADKVWLLDVYITGTIRVFDASQGRLSHTVDGLNYTSSRNVIRLYQGTKLAFEANMNQRGLNSYNYDAGRAYGFNCKFR